MEELAGTQGVNSQSALDVAVPESPLTASIDDDGPVLLSQRVDESDGRFTEAVRLNREHWLRTGRPISA